MKNMVAFSMPTEALKSSPVLVYLLQDDKSFILGTDTNNESIGAVLYRKIDGHKHVLFYDNGAPKTGILKYNIQQCHSEKI